MRKILFITGLLLFCGAGKVYAQNGRYDNQVFRFSVTGAFPASGATVTVCQAGATVTYVNTPLAPSCTPLATIYTSASSGTPAANPFQADANGNFGFWAPSGQYVVTEAGQNLAGYTLNVTLPVTANANIAFTGNNTHANINNLCFVDGTTNTTIPACDTFLGAANGQIWVTKPLTISALVTGWSSGHDIVCWGDNVILTLSTATAGLQQPSNTRIKNCQFNSTQTAGAPAVFSQGTNNVEAENVTCNGGGKCVFYNTVSNSRITRPRVLGLTGPDYPIIVSASDHVQIASPRIEAFTMPTSASSFRAISVQNGSSFVEVSDPIVRDIDGTQVPTFAGVSFSNCSNCVLNGGLLSNLKNGDGFACEGGSTDITVNGTISTGNSNTAGAGANANTGDGFDIFNCGRVHLNNVIARNNGNLSTNRHHQIEVFTSADVEINGGEASDGGLFGVSVVGSPRTKVKGLTASRNFQDGLQTADTSTVCNTNGTAVTGTSGTVFGLQWPANTTIVIAGTPFLISSVTDGTHLTLTTSAGVQTGVSCPVSSTDVQILGGNYDGNGLGVAGAQIQVAISFTGASTGVLTGVTATDTKATKTQLYGFRTDNTARAVLIGNNFRGNLTGRVLDNVGNSPEIFEDGSTKVFTLTSPTISAPTVTNGMTATGTGDANGFSFTGGNGVSVQGGSFTATAGNGTSSASGGTVVLTAGNGATGSAGSVSVNAGNGTANNLNGGNITLTPGTPNGTGANGTVTISATGAFLFYPSSVLFANLGTPANGALIYCSNCTIANPCAGAGTGAMAKRLNGVWVCN